MPYRTVHNRSRTSQDKYEVKGVYKGNYDEAMTAAIAAFRAKQHPNLIQIFEVGTASMMAAKGAIRPVYEIMEAAGTPVDTSKLLGSVAMPLFCPYFYK